MADSDEFDDSSTMEILTNAIAESNSVRNNSAIDDILIPLDRINQIATNELKICSSKHYISQKSTSNVITSIDRTEITFINRKSKKRKHIHTMMGSFRVSQPKLSSTKIPDVSSDNEDGMITTKHNKPVKGIRGTRKQGEFINENVEFSYNKNYPRKVKFVSYNTSGDATSQLLIRSIEPSIDTAPNKNNNAYNDVLVPNNRPPTEKFNFVKEYIQLYPQEVNKPTKFESLEELLLKLTSQKSQVDISGYLHNDSITISTPLDYLRNVCNNLNYEIGLCIGYTFANTTSKLTGKIFYSSFHCNLDKSKARIHKGTKRIHKVSRKYDCGSNLKFKVNLATSEINFSINHIEHPIDNPDGSSQ